MRVAFRLDPHRRLDDILHGRTRDSTHPVEAHLARLPSSRSCGCRGSDIGPRSPYRNGVGPLFEVGRGALEVRSSSSRSGTRRRPACPEPPGRSRRVLHIAPLEEDLVGALAVVDVVAEMELTSSLTCWCLENRMCPPMSKPNPSFQNVRHSPPGRAAFSSTPMDDRGSAGVSDH